MSVLRTFVLDPPGAPGRPPVESTWARFQARLGRPVVRRAGVEWVPYRAGFWMSLPMHLRLDDATPRDLFGAGPPWALRHPTCGPGLDGGLYHLDPTGWSILSVHPKARAATRRGLERTEVRHVDAAALATAGLLANVDTLGRQARAAAEFTEPVRWRRWLAAVESTPGLTLHGGYVEGTLAAWALTCREGDWLHVVHKMSRTDLRAHHADNALDATILREAAAAGVHHVGNGEASLLPNPGLDEHKRRLGYRIVPHHLALRLPPGLDRLVANRMSSDLVARLAAARPDEARWPYAARMLDGLRASRG